MSSIDGIETPNDPVTVDQVFDACVTMILRADGDRDHMNPSALNCNQSMVILATMRKLQKDRTALTEIAAELSADAKWQNAPYDLRKKAKAVLASLESEGGK